MLSGRLIRTLMVASLWAGASVAALEAASLWLVHGVSGVALIALSAATWTLSVALLVFWSLLLGAAATARGLAAWLTQRGTSLRARPARRWTLACSALVVALGLHAANVTQYVRLYLAAHMALSLGTLLCAHGACVLLLLGQPHAEARRDSHLPRWLGVTIGACALFATLASVVHVTVDVALRSHALEQSSVLGHELRVLDHATGILAATELEVSATLDPALLAALAPEPVRAPSGLVHGAHVVLVTIDSLRADRWIAGGAAHPFMPALEALGAEGVRFARAYAPSCWTVHSMSSVLFGRLPSQLHFTPVGVSADYQFLPFDVRAAENPLNFKRATPVPFDEQGTSLIDVLRASGYQTATVAPYIFYFRAAGLTADFEVVDEEGYRALGFGTSGIAPVDMVERAASFLAHRDPARPFFLWLHFMDPHAPYEARDEAARGGGPETRYDSELRQVDAQLAALRAVLRSHGLDERTLWIVHGDHGEEFGDHGGSFHASTLYDEVVRVPLLLRLPAAPSTVRRVVDTPISLLDMGPTLLDLLGIAGSPPLMGRSLRPELTGATPEGRPILMECDRFAARKRAYLRWPFKLIVDRATGALQLYALPGDPHERVNLATEKPDLLRLMAGELVQLEGALAPP